MSVKWIKIVTNIFDDEKIRLIETLPDSDTVLVIWFKLLTMAAKCCDNGVVYLTREIPYTPEMLSTLMRRPVNTIRMALTEFQRLGMIDIENDFISILNWEKHQAMDKLEMAKEQTRKRVAKHREKQKEVCNVTSPLQVTQCNADRIDIDKDIDKEKREEKQSRFAPPSLQELQKYLDENNISCFTATQFIDFYDSKGWMIGKNKMKDWKAAVRTWTRRADEKEPTDNYKEL